MAQYITIIFLRLGHSNIKQETPARSPLRPEGQCASAVVHYIDQQSTVNNDSNKNNADDDEWGCLSDEDFLLWFTG